MVPEQQNVSVGAQEQNFAAGEKHSAVVATEEQNFSPAQEKNSTPLLPQEQNVSHQRKKFYNCGSRTAEVCPKTE